MTRILQRPSLLSLIFCLLTSWLYAERSVWDVASASYGRGVHAYFAGRYSDADAYLSQAQANELNDPRPYYFRALTLLRLGRSAEACEEFGVAASFEAEAPNRFAVGAALQRVQGSDRLLLEKYRRMARASVQSLKSQARMSDQQRTFDQEVLYQPVIVPLDEFLSEGRPRALSAEELARSVTAAGARAAATASTPTAPAPIDPFQDDTAATTSPPPAEPAMGVEIPTADVPRSEEEMPAEDTAAPAEEDAPAESAGPDSEDPFGDL
jgi:hypothetical protein